MEGKGKKLKVGCKIEAKRKRGGEKRYFRAVFI